METYSIEVTEDIAAKIRILWETGLFSMRNGSCEVHMDTMGTISQVILHTYHRIQKLSTVKEFDREREGVV